MKKYLLLLSLLLTSCACYHHEEVNISSNEALLSQWPTFIVIVILWYESYATPGGII